MVVRSSPRSRRSRGACSATRSVRAVRSVPGDRPAGLTGRRPGRPGAVKPVVPMVSAALLRRRTRARSISTPVTPTSRMTPDWPNPADMRALKRGDLTGPNPVDRGKFGSKIHLITERTGQRAGASARHRPSPGHPSAKRRLRNAGAPSRPAAVPPTAPGSGSRSSSGSERSASTVRLSSWHPTGRPPRASGFPRRASRERRVPAESGPGAQRNAQPPAEARSVTRVRTRAGPSGSSRPAATAD